MTAPCVALLHFNELGASCCGNTAAQGEDSQRGLQGRALELGTGRAGGWSLLLLMMLKMSCVICLCSVHEVDRRVSLAPFRAAGFRLRAAVMILPDQHLFLRQAQQFASEGKCVEERTIAEMRGTAAEHLTGNVSADWTVEQYFLANCRCAIGEGGRHKRLSLRDSCFSPIRKRSPESVHSTCSQNC